MCIHKIEYAYVFTSIYAVFKKNCCNMQCCGLCSLADTDAQQDDDIQDDQDKLVPPLFKTVTEDLQRYW